MHTLLYAHLAALIPGLKKPMAAGRLLRHAEWFFQKRARTKAFAVLFVFLLAITLRVALLPLVPPGIPVVHDEYSYLLQADTFASGRLTNPPHPMWEHFETFHVLQQPTYASKFFPGQALFLALGQAVLGHPWWGVVLSLGCFSAAMTWMLQAFLPPGWAFFGGIATALQYGTIHYFATSYWGGAAPAMAGCLALGAVGRLLCDPRPRHGVWLGIGAVMLAATRPYEGGIYCVGLLVWLAVHALRRGRFGALLRRGLLPSGLVLGLGAAALFVYFKAVTGNAFYPPYVAYNDAYYYGQGLAFTDNKPLAAPLRHEVMQRYLETWALPTLREGSTWKGMVASIPSRLDTFASLLDPIYYVPMLLAPLAMALLPGLRPLVALFGLAVAVSFSVAWSLPHYFAASLGGFVCMWLMTLRWLRCVTVAGRPVGLSLVRLLPLILVVFTGLAVYQYPKRGNSDMETKARLRQDLELRLRGIAGKHLVVVRYLPDSNVHAEWVYNAADIDNAPVVWARDLGPEKNAALFACFKDHNRWCATVGGARINIGPCAADGGFDAPATP